jgi:sucrose phosphorylase
VTVLDTHDGLGMIDAAPGDGHDGLLTAAQIEALVGRIEAGSGGTAMTSRVPGGGYQVSCTADDALGRDDRAYLLARLLHLFTPGIPQVYYVGLLAGSNVAPGGGDAREINRRRYTAAEVDEARERPVVRTLLELVRLRGAHPAFTGEFAASVDGEELLVTWRHGAATAELSAELSRGTWRATFAGTGPTRTLTDADLRAAPQG